MQQIRQAIKRKQAQAAQLAKEIELLLQAEEKLREIAPLLAEEEGEEEGSLLVEVEDEVTQPGAHSAESSEPQPAAAQTEPARAVALRWP